VQRHSLKSAQLSRVTSHFNLALEHRRRNPVWWLAEIWLLYPIAARVRLIRRGAAMVAVNTRRSRDGSCSRRRQP
jgi:hypothetical protein